MPSNIIIITFGVFMQHKNKVVVLRCYCNLPPWLSLMILVVISELIFKNWTRDRSRLTH